MLLFLLRCPSTKWRVPCAASSVKAVAQSPLERCVYETDQAVGIERRNGVLDGLKEYGITPVTGKSDYSFIGGQTVTRELLERESDLDAIICATDRGYDESTLLTPELTTLKFDSYGMGYLGAETILKMITGEPVSKKQIVGYEFIEGGSVRS